MSFYVSFTKTKNKELQLVTYKRIVCRIACKASRTWLPLPGVWNMNYFARKVSRCGLIVREELVGGIWNHYFYNLLANSSSGRWCSLQFIWSNEKWINFNFLFVDRLIVLSINENTNYSSLNLSNLLHSYGPIITMFFLIFRSDWDQ